MSHIKKRKITLYLTVVILALVITGAIVSAQSQNAFRPVQDTIHVFPGEISGDGWVNKNALLVQDLGEYALFQSFDKDNSAYLGEEQAETIETTNTPIFGQGAAAESGVRTDTASTSGELESTSEPNVENSEGADDEEISTDVAPETAADEPAEDAPEPDVVPPEDPSVAPAPEEVTYFGPLNNVAQFFKRTTGVFLFAQQSTTTATNTAAEDEDAEQKNTADAETEVVSENNEEDVVDEAAVAPEVLEEATTTPEETVTELESEDTSRAGATTTASSTGAAVSEGESESARGTSSIDTTASSTTAVAVPEEPEFEQIPNEIVLTDFAIPELESGQFVDGMQLRFSLGAQYEIDASSTIPSVDVSYAFGGLKGEAGSVLLDTEVSNAINGGYFVVALPAITDPSALENLSVTLAYNGDAERLQDLYIDAAWLELRTVTYDKNLLKKRASIEGLSHLKRPEIAELLSEKLDFLQSEAPVFSIKYSSQRNFFVRTVRNLFGRDLARVEDVRVLHRGMSSVVLNPQVTVTKDGLITIELDEENKKHMRPGQYTVEVEIAEGGKTFKDSFDFQWGLLSINSNKSEYQTGEVASISMGALTPNGNTLCNADLQLYIVDPKGYISLVPVAESGQCKGNNVVAVPDYSTQYVTSVHGEYEMYLERLDENGNVIAHTSDVFNVVNKPDFTIERIGPTRIYPAAPYDMTLVVEAKNASINGTIFERVPKEFDISNTDAEVRVVGDYKELVWDITSLASSTKVFRYTFDAPDLSPYLYTLGPAELVSESRGSNNRGEASGGASSTATTTEESTPQRNSRDTFVEYRAWQIASDATGNMILFWDGAAIPNDWSCLSCGSGTFFQNFVIGSSTYNTTGGAAAHTPTANGSVLASSLAITENFNSGAVADVAHTHTYAPTIGSASNLPNYRELRVIQYTAGAGEPTDIPAGAIGIFDTTVPSGWTRYDAQDGYYVRGSDSPGTTGGSNTHTHTLTGTTGAAGGSTEGSRGGGSQATGATAGHTHTVSSTTPQINSEPPYIEVILGKLDATTTPPNGLITMWTEDVPTGWLDVSSLNGDPFNNRFLKGAASYGATGGGFQHTHTDVTGITSSNPVEAGTAARNDPPNTGSDDAHTHSVSVTNFSQTSNTPPFVTAVFGKRQGTDPVYEQRAFRWYANEDNQTPTDPWPLGAGGLLENEPLTATSTVLKTSDEIRLRINLAVANATSSPGEDFILQYGAGEGCNAISTWHDVGDTSSSTALWRGYDNASVSDNSTLASTTLTDTTVAATYEENGYATNTPNEIGIDEVGEWDFVLQHNNALADTNYCFRMVNGDGSPFFTYTTYPSLRTNAAPPAPTVLKLFDNEMTASTTPWFEFVSTDPEGESLNYQIQVDNNSDFSSTVFDRNTTSHGSQFSNRVVPTDKDPYTSGELMRFMSETTLSDGTTYYVRVRARDPEGSNSWGTWSTTQSFTIDTGLTVSAWHQTEDDQFDTNTLTGLETGSDAVALISGSSTGSMVSTPIDFDDGENGTAWGLLTFSETDPSSVITYQLEYFTDASTWALIPDAAISGNSTGLTAPTSLLDLDTDTYNVIRLVVNFTAATGGPSLEDWTIEWGYRVETPTISKLFSNEKVGTTTPTFEFLTTDPQDDSLTYQVQWSTTPDFTSSTTRTSDTDGGFSNINNQGDTDPFDSGDTIRFTIEAGDALTNNTTYWWRVRAKDTTGDDSYSFWTDARSFTVDTTVVVSTWFQTTEEQFDTNILSGTVGLANDAVGVATTASEAMLVYGEGVVTSPRYRQWDGAAWSTEGSLADVGAPIKWTVVQAATTREEYVAATVGTDGDVNAQVFTLGEWSDLVEVTSSMGNVNARGFDLTYETISGDALLVYCDGDADPSYYVWDGNSWTSGGTINLASTNNCEWIKLASDPDSDEIILMSRDSDGTGAASYQLAVWDGNSWTVGPTQGGARSTAYETMALQYEDGGAQTLAISGDGNPTRFEYNSWTTSWAGLATNNTITDNLIWAELARDEGTDNMAMCYIDESANVGVIRWTGGGWAGQTDLDGAANGVADRAVSCVYESTSGRDGNAMVVYSDTTNARYQVWNGATWSGEASVDTITDSATIQTRRTGVGTILALFFDDVNDQLDFSYWNGSAWSTAQTLETNASVDTAPFGEPFMMAPRNANTEGSVIVSPGVEFTDGLGPYWDSFSWVDTIPGASDILYSIQYYDGDSWEFVPNSEIPGNDSGTTTSPIDLSGLNVGTYGTLRPYAALTCDGSSNCPEILDWTIEWAEGITVSGTLQDYSQSSDINGGQVAVAVNGELQVGKTGSVSSGQWSISNVTAFAGDVITVFVDGAASDAEAVGVTRYDGSGDISGFQLFERHVALGSNDATSTPLTNADITLYNVSNDEDVFLGGSGTSLDVCADTTGCFDARLFVNASTTYGPQGTLVTHDIEINGTLTATTTLYVDGSWDNNGTTTLTNSTVVFTATSTTETLDDTGANTPGFNNLTFGTTTGNATWSLSTALDVNGTLNVTRGTLSRSTLPITLAGSLTTGANGFWSGVGTTTFDGSGARNWRDQNATLQNVGDVVIDGSSKNITLNGNVAANSITIGADDILDVSGTHYDITVYGDWINNNTFAARQGEVFMNATTTGIVVTANGDSFFDLTFSGVGGGWSFTESNLTVGNDFTIATGTVNLPTATTTVAGSFDSTGGTFAHSNGVLRFTSTGAETITADGSGFVNPFNDLTFDGSGSWTMADVNATSSGSVRINSGTLGLPTGIFAIDESFINDGGAVTHNSGTLQFTGNGNEVVTFDGITLSSLLFTGGGSYTITDTNATLANDITVQSGTSTLPSGTLTLGGTFTNNDNFIHSNGALLFNSTDTGETINPGDDTFYDVTINGVGGGFTVIANATTTNDFTITNANDFTVNSGSTLSVGGDFANTLGGSATTWTGSTLSLTSGSAYPINGKTDTGDAYETLSIAANTDVSMWNSSATTTSVDSTGSLYSQDHAGIDGVLNIYGSYARASGTEHWDYATDFDGTDLTGGSERIAQVRFASDASASITGSTLQILGSAGASSTITSLSGTYAVDVSASTINARYYEFEDLGATGLSLLASTTVTNLNDGSFTVAASGGSGMTVASTTVDTNPGLQIFRTTFATTTPISAFNVTQSDGVPSSFWWFRNGYGNLLGENYDNDDNDPGSIRWDDSSLTITIEGTVYTDEGVSPLAGGTCDGSTDVVRVVVEGGGTYDEPCGLADGFFSVPNVVVTGDPTITIFLNDASGGEHAVAVTKTPTGNITDLDLYQNRVIVRHESTEAMTIADMNAYDAVDDDDVLFTAATGTPDTLMVSGPAELHVHASSTFAPGGNVTLLGGAGTAYSGTLHVDNDATFESAGTETHTIGGRFQVDQGGSFAAATSSVVMTATSTGKNITTPSPQILNFNTLSFTGSGGEWSIDADITAADGIAVDAGTIIGGGDITIASSSLSGAGAVSMSDGTVTIEGANTLGSSTPWTFNNLTLGDGSAGATTRGGETATTTILGTLTIATAHTLTAGDSNWDLRGSGNAFVESGTFNEGTSRVRYSTSTSANILSTTYYDLDLNAVTGSPTYTATGLGINVLNNLSIGGGTNTTVNVTTNDPVLQVGNDLTIKSNGTLVASDSASFTVSGSWDNDGTFTASGGSVTFDTSGNDSIAAGSSSFANVIATSTGALTVTEHATATEAFTIGGGSFTQSSGTTLAVGGNFSNLVADGLTTWTGSTLRLYGGSYEINSKTTEDAYENLVIAPDTDVSMWNSSAASIVVDSTGSLYSQDHSDIDGFLYIFGEYRHISGTDYWSYATDFDGADLTGSERAVTVFIEDGATVRYTGGALEVVGDASASTTIRNQGSGTYTFAIGGNTTVNMNYYDVYDTDSAGLTFYGTPTVTDLSFGDYYVTTAGGSGITVGGATIDQNPAKNFTSNHFSTSTAISAFNVTATGTSLSSWRFANHTGNLSGEAFDVDPGGNPGYVVWEDSAEQITISGNVYQDEGSIASGVCDGTTQNIHLRIAGLTSTTTSCNGGSGAYSFPGISYNSNDMLVVFIEGEAVAAANVTVDPVSSIGNMDLYESRVIVRHENTNPITIDDLEVWDSDDNADIPYDAENGSPDTLVLPSDTKLVVWNNKTFAPGGNVTISGGGGGGAHDGTLALRTGSTFEAAGTESHTIGGSLTASSSATFDAANSAVTFTTTGADRIVDVNENDFYDITFNGSGSWIVTDPTLTVASDLTITSGAVTLPSATTTVTGSFDNTGGSFSHSSSTVYMAATAAGETIEAGGSDFYNLTFNGVGGGWAFQDTNATVTAYFTVENGDVTLPSGVLAVGNDFSVVSGSLVHNSGTVRMTATSSGTILDTNGSDLSSLAIDGAGTFAMSDASLTLLDDLTINQGTLTLATNTLTIGGSFLNTGGSFNTNATGTILFNSNDTGEFVNPGNSDFHNVTFANAAGGWTMSAHATATNNFTLTSASNFTLGSGNTLAVLGVFTNSEGGTDTSWNGTLRLGSGSSYTVGATSTPSESYNTLEVYNGTDIRFWNSAATTTTVSATSSVYSQDHAGTDGDLYIYGDYTRAAGTDYWSYTTDFDGDDISGSPRAVNVYIANGATTTITNPGVLQMIGTAAATTTVQNQGSGSYAFEVTNATLNAQYYSFNNLDADGLQLTGAVTTISDLSQGEYTLAVNGGALITLDSNALDANASRVFSNVRFATTTAITGTNVLLSGTTSNSWTFTGHSGNFDGEAYDSDGAFDGCGAIRWDDSTCLLVQQTHTRWRADDGGEGVPNSEWYDTDWDYRKRVRVENNDATPYSTTTVELTVAYDSDMQADFDDLRFTDETGTVPIPYWIETYTASTEATVWVKVPLIPANDTATVFMYYGNGAATDASSGTTTFEVFDDFEDGDISEYSGETGLFNVGSTYNYEHTFGLDVAGNEPEETVDGIYRTDVSTAQGHIIRFFDYINTVDGSGDEVCTLFGVQAPGSDNNNYALCLEQFGTDRIVLSKDVTSRDITGTVLASSTLAGGDYVDGWYEVEIDWQTDDTIDVTLLKDDAVIATTSASDSDYDSGGIGFTYWGQNGGWDIYTARKRMETLPTIYFGVEQTNGGASWLSAQDAEVTGVVAGDRVRARIMIENTGSDISDQNFQLEYAAKGAAPSCEAVSGGSYTAVPNQASCGASEICMQTSSNITNLASTTDLLTGGEGAYTYGQIIESPSNTTGNIDVVSGEYTEVEYVLTPTINVSDTNYCFRVTDTGTPLDSYPEVAELEVRFTPSISALSLNGGLNIDINPGATTTVYATGTVSDQNGSADLAYATVTIYRSGVGESCTEDDNNCYRSATPQCSFQNCSGNTCDVSCTADIYYFADPTDDGPYAGESWRAYLEVADNSGEIATATAPSIDLSTTRALYANANVNYGALAPETNTGTYTPTTTIQNIGNDSIDISVEGGSLTDGLSSLIPASQQVVATTTFDYGSCGVSVCFTLSTSTNLILDLDKPTTTAVSVTDDIYWGIEIPFGIAANPHQGANTIYAIDDI